MFFPFSVSILVALTAIDLMLGRKMGVGQRRVLHVVWAIVFLAMALAMPGDSSNPGYDNEELADTAPY